MNRAQRRALERQTLWRVEVTDATGGDVYVGPATNVRDVAEELCQEINLSVSRGAEKTWRDARVVPVKSIQT